MLGERGEEEAGRMLVPAVPPQLDENRVSHGGGVPTCSFFPPIFNTSGQELEVSVPCCSKDLVAGEGGSRDSKEGRKGWSNAFGSPAGP